jgi:hypothetical protein
VSSYALALSHLIQQLNKPELASVKALLIDLVGDRAAADMLERLLMWWDKTSNPDGWVYKSYKHWWSECRIPQRALADANKALEAVGVERDIRKAEGAPVSHYRLDEQRFSASIATVIGKPISDVLGIISKSISKAEPAPENGFSETEGKPEKSITTYTAQDPTHVVAGMLSDFGVKGPVLQRVAASSTPEQVAAAIEAAQKRAKENPAGFVVDALRYGWNLSPVEAADHAAREGDEPSARDEGKGVLPSEEATAVDEQPLTPLPPAPHAEEPTRPVEEDAEQLWYAAMCQMEAQFDRASFDTWVRGAALLGRQPGLLVVQVSNQYALDMLQHRLYRDVRRLARDIFGERELELSFQVEAKDESAGSTGRDQQPAARSESGRGSGAGPAHHHARVTPPGQRAQQPKGSAANHRPFAG